MARNLLKPKAPLLEGVLRLVDPLWLIAAAVLAHLVYFDRPPYSLEYGIAIGVGAVYCVILFAALDLYRSQRGVSVAVELSALSRAWLVFALSGALFLFATKTGATYSRVWSGLWVALGFTGHALIRTLLRLVLRTLRRRGFNLRHVVVVGAGPLGADVAQRLADASWGGLAVRGFYDDDPARIGTRVAGTPVEGPVGRLLEDLREGGIDQVWIALPLKEEDRIRALLQDLRDHPVQICFVPDIYGFNLLHHSFSEVAGLPVIQLTDTPLQGWSQVLKAMEDYLLAAFILIATSPLLAVIAAGVKLSSRGPVLYRQERITWNGSRFQMLKFRTMPVDAEHGTGPVWARAGEKRATRFGQLLRRTSLDELPQFLNVLKGEMSIVGPRPERPQFVEEFRKQIPGYMQKHLVKAGITGWAQVNDLRGNTDLAKRIQYDLYYIENWSIWFDLRIMILTALNVYKSRNAY
jgi:putative colanic acid biosynthesis UDP-glucose lipid carrier transferase